MPRGVHAGVKLIMGFPMHFKKYNCDETEATYHCVHRNRRIRCLASYVQKADGSCRIIQDHYGHEENSTHAQAEVARERLKELALSTSLKPRSLAVKLRAEFRPEVILTLGDYNGLRRIIDCVRTRTNIDKKSVNNGEGIQGVYTKTNDGDRFLLIEMTINSKPLVIFASDKCLQMLQASKVILVDGTFECTSDKYTQLFTIHGYISESVVRPLVYCLLASKEQVEYERVLHELKLLPN